MKKVFIGVLAALMLFAFTACEPQQMDWPYTGEDAKDVMGITLVTSSDVVLHAGEEFDTIYTPINIAYKDGTSDSDIIAEISLSGNAAIGQNKMSVKWGGEFTNTGYVIVDAIEATSINLVIENTTDLASAPTTGTATIVYSDGFEVTDTNYGVVAGETENTVVAKLEKGSRSSVDLTSNEVAYTLEGPAPEAQYGDIRVIFTKTDGSLDEADADELWIGDNVYLEVVNYSTTTNDKFVLEATDFELVQNGVLLSSTQKTAALGAKELGSKTGATYSVYVNGEVVDTVTVPAGQNFMTSSSYDTVFTATSTPATPGITKISTNLFTTDMTKLEYKVPLTELASNDGIKVISVVNNDLAIPSDATGETYPITVNIEVTKQGVVSKSTVTVNVPLEKADA